MATMMGNLYQAFVEGGVSIESATKAAEEVANYRKPLIDIRSNLAFVEALLGVAATGVVALVIHIFFG